MRQPVLPARTWISSATMLTASSSGVSAPMSSPMGECTRSIAVVGEPGLAQRLDDLRPLAPARHEPDVPRRRAQRLDEHVDVVGVAASDDDDVGGVVHADALERVVERTQDDLGAGETGG